MAAKYKPSPKVMAAMHLRAALKGECELALPAADVLQSMHGTKIDDAKRAKIVDQLDKMTKPLRDRLDKVIAKFEGGPTPRKSKSAA